jgi:hypothetical protein
LAGSIFVISQLHPSVVTVPVLLPTNSDRRKALTCAAATWLT